ncbi:MAG: H/ACA RNA-protein complex protein Gar1 [Candidatus Thermoplasmatota archaeon]|jgi:rRNA processing protein Gar1|nr:H/ACA RNA-protein complex protein Gar1 [Candidatus Thermoplasmatota archaeon]
MFRPLKVSQILKKEAVIRDAEEGMMNKAVYDSKGNKIGKIIRIMGPVTDAYGLVALNTEFNSDEHMFVKL